MKVFACALLLSALVGTFSTRGYFLGDDFGQIARFSTLSLAEWRRLFVEEWSGGIWGFPLPELRPVLALSYMIDARLWGAVAQGFRLTNLLIYMASGLLVGGLALRISGGKRAAAVAATLLYLAHPVHAGAVGWISGRSDSLAAVLVFSALLTFLEYRRSGHAHWLAVSAGSFALAVFTKEVAVALPVLAFVVDPAISGLRELRHRTPRLLPYAIWAAIGAGYAVCRWHALGVGMAGTPPRAVELAHRQLVYLGEALPLLEHAVPRTASSSSLAGLALFWSIAGLLWALARRPRSRDSVAPVLLLAGVWFLAATAPLVFVQYAAPRHILLAVAGPCIAAGLLFAGDFRPRVAVASLALVVLGLLSVLHTQLVEWRWSGELSTRIRTAIIEMNRTVPAAAPLILDVPAWTASGTFVWSFASPFALRPPFVPVAVDGSRSVLTPPAVDFHPETWFERLETFATRQDHARSAFLVSVTEAGDTSMTEVPLGRLQDALDRLRRQRGAKDASASWADFVGGLLANERHVAQRGVNSLKGRMLPATGVSERRQLPPSGGSGSVGRREVRVHDGGDQVAGVVNLPAVQ